MKKEYDSNSEREYTAPEAQGIVEPEPMIHNWVKRPISYLVSLSLFLNSIGFFLTIDYRNKELPKSKIEERIDKDYNDKGGLARFFMDDVTKPGRELAYLIFGDGEQEK